MFECIEVDSFERSSFRIDPGSDPVVKCELTGQALKGCSNSVALNDFPCEDTNDALVIGMQTVLRGTGSNEVFGLQELAGKPVTLVDITCVKDAFTERSRVWTQLTGILQKIRIQNTRTGQYIDVSGLLALQLLRTR